MITAKEYDIAISGDFSEQVTARIVQEINHYISEERQAKTSFMSKVSGFLTGKSKRDLAERINHDMVADLARSRYFVGEKEISVAGDEDASFQSFAKETSQDEFKWIDNNIEIISKFFHQGLVQIVLSQLFKVTEEMPVSQIFKENVSGFDKGLNNITLDRYNQDIKYYFYENQSIELIISARVKNAGYITKAGENGASTLIIADNEQLVSSVDNKKISKTVPKSQLYIKIGFSLEKGEFSIQKKTVNQYALFLDAKKIMNV